MTTRCCRCKFTVEELMNSESPEGVEMQYSVLARPVCTLCYSEMGFKCVKCHGDAEVDLEGDRIGLYCETCRPTEEDCQSGLCKYEDEAGINKVDFACYLLTQKVGGVITTFKVCQTCNNQLYQEVRKNNGLKRKNGLMTNQAGDYVTSTFIGRF